MRKPGSGYEPTDALRAVSGWRWVVALVALSLIAVLAEVNPDAPPMLALQNPTRLRFAFINGDNDLPTSWTCAPIRVVLDQSIATAGIEADVRAAIRDVETVSAFTFDVIGSVDHQPNEQWATESSAFGADVIYAVSSPERSELVEGEELAAANLHIVFEEPRSRFVAGAVVFNADRLEELTPGMGPMSVGAVATHETLHILGLDHVKDSRSIMTADINDGSAMIGPGDVNGLAVLDQAACDSRESTGFD
jgi:hypothetical protein